MRHCVMGLLVGLLCNCVAEKRDVSPSHEAQALALDVQRICKTDFDCRLINQDCCGEETGFVAVNDRSALSLSKGLNDSCRAQFDADKDLCKDKKKVDRKDFPKIACETGLCTVKPKDDSGAEAAQAACEADFECTIFDQSCCDTKDELIAINFRSGVSVREKKLKDCREKRQKDPSLCASGPTWFAPQKEVKCVQKVCTIQ